jgi:hypothetical protein
LRDSLIPRSCLASASWKPRGNRLCFEPAFFAQGAAASGATCCSGHDAVTGFILSDIFECAMVAASRNPAFA